MKSTLTLLSLACLLIAPASRADEPYASGAPAKGALSLMSFRAAFLGAFQGSSNSFTGELSWNPDYALTDDIGIDASLGGILFNGNSSNYFVAFDYKIGANYSYKSWMGELALGAQTWFNSGSVTAFAASYSVHYRFVPRFLGLVDTVFVEYAPVFQSQMVHELKAGVQIVF